MILREFLEKIEIELKISKSSEHTIKAYLRANKELLDFIGKNPEEINKDDVKKFLAETISQRASSSCFLALSKSSSLPFPLYSMRCISPLEVSKVTSG